MAFRVVLPRGDLASAPLCQARCESIEEVGCDGFVGVHGGGDREFVFEYESQVHGRKALWLQTHDISTGMMARWRSAVVSGDLDRGFVPRNPEWGVGRSRMMDAVQKRRDDARAVRDAEVEKLTARIRELEQVNEVLGKAIGLLHQRNEQEPDVNPTMADPSDSSTTTPPSSAN